MRRRWVAAICLMLLAGCAPGTQPATSPTSAALASSPAASSLPRPTVQATPLPACLPLCAIPRLVEPGPLHAGPYQTRYYFGGQLLVQIPDDSWVSGEDSTGEFDLHTVRQSALEFWMNIYPVQGPPDVERDPGYDGTATGLVDWVAANPNVKVVERRPGTLAGMPAEVIEFERAPDAVNDDPGCPQEFQPCVTLFGFEQWDGFFGSAGPFVNRLYAADLTWGGSSHVVSAMIWADTRTDFEAFVGDAATIIEGAKLPAGVTPG